MAHLLNRWMLVLTLVLGVALYGCGSSEEATGGATEDAQPLGEAKPAEQNADDQALTSFVGEKEPAKQEAAAPAQTTAPAGQLGQYEKQIEDLRTENTTLKQRIVKLEQDNRTLNTMMSETEGKVEAARLRSDSLEALLAAQPQTAAPAAAAPNGGAPATTEPSMAISSYEDALRAFNAKRYDDARNAFQAMIESGIQADLMDNCKYWVGECNFAKKRYKEAVANFDEVLAMKNSEKKGDAQFMMAQSYERMGDKVKAKEGYEKVVKEYPLSRVVKKAKERWARL